MRFTSSLIMARAVVASGCQSSDRQGRIRSGRA
jgi:hypothetical protein